MARGEELGSNWRARLGWGESERVPLAVPRAYWGRVLDTRKAHPRCVAFIWRVVGSRGMIKQGNDLSLLLSPFCFLVLRATFSPLLPGQ